MNRAFWLGKKVLVTGHTGFKGSWLSCWLQAMGADVVGYALAPQSGANLFHEADVGAGMVSVEGDVRDLEHLTRVMQEHQPQIVLHLAAQALVRRSYDDPVFTYTTNVIGSVNLLEAVRRTPGVRAVVMVTSDKSYANQEWVWAYRETDRLGGRDPYSSSKACAELVVQAYRDSFFPVNRYSEHGVAVATARAGNVIGGGDHGADRLIPDIIRALLEPRPVMIRSPDATRPWQFVLEAICGYLVLAEHLWNEGPKVSESWNFGPDSDDVKPVSWVADYMTRRWSDDARWISDQGLHPHEANLLMLDCTKAKKLLGWRPRLRLPMTLDWIIEWNRTALAQGSMRATLDDQIRRYEVLS